MQGCFSGRPGSQRVLGGHAASDPRAARADEPGHRPIDAGVQVAAAPVAGEEAVQLRQQAHRRERNAAWVSSARGSDHLNARHQHAHERSPSTAAVGRGRSWQESRKRGGREGGKDDPSCAGFVCERNSWVNWDSSPACTLSTNVSNSSAFAKMRLRVCGFFFPSLSFPSRTAMSTRILSPS